MKRAKEFHDRAMKYADAAFLAKFKGHADEAKRYFEKAFLEEKQAALIIASSDKEPTRSVLHRSAATLALHCGEVREAEKLVASALAGDPPEAIAEELREIFEEAQFERHLQLRGVTLADNELQVTFAGKAIRAGLALKRAVFTRVGDLEKLLNKTSERVSRQRLQVSNVRHSNYDLYISAPRAGSISFTLSFGMSEQNMFPELDDSNNVIDEIIECIELLERQKHLELQQKIGDPEYFGNFVDLARKIAPDGEEITLVGLTSVRKGKEEKSVSFSRLREEIPESPPYDEGELTTELSASLETVTGILRYADSLKNKNEVRLEVEDGRAWKIIVAEGEMGTVVGQNWGRLVTVRGYRVLAKRKTLQLEEIVQSEDNEQLLI